MFPSPLLSAPPICSLDTDNGTGAARSAKTLPQANASAGSLDATGAGVSPSMRIEECPGCQRLFSVERTGLIPRHGIGRDPFNRTRQATRQICHGSSLLVLGE